MPTLELDADEILSDLGGLFVEHRDLDPLVSITICDFVVDLIDQANGKIYELEETISGIHNKELYAEDH